MKINLEQIKASPKPIRTTWDNSKMNDLSLSLIEEGQVEPIGVFPGNKSAELIAHYDGDLAGDEALERIFDIERMHGEPEYTIVWGHRRVEAARRANWEEIEAVIVPEDEVKNLIQAGIENLAGEDMTADDKADWAYRLTEL